jgi:hypothetical protein
VSTQLRLFAYSIKTIAAYLIVLSIILPFQFTFVWADSSNSSSHNKPNQAAVFSNISGTYTIPNVGFEITLPDGWRGIDLVSLAMASPKGINPTTGGLKPTGESNRVLLVLGSINASDFLVDKKAYNTSTYQEFVKKTAERIGCTVLSDSFVKINGMNSEKISQECGTLGEQKSTSYIFASGKNVIFIGLKGIRPAFDHNLEKFKQSLQTIKIDKPTDIENVISELYVRNP